MRWKSARRPMRRSRRPAGRRSPQRRARRESALRLRCRLSQSPSCSPRAPPLGILSAPTDPRPLHRRRRPRPRTSPSSCCLSPIFPATQPKTISPTALPKILPPIFLASPAPSSSRATRPLPSRVRMSTRGISARSSAFATYWKVQYSAIRIKCASMRSSSTPRAADIFGRRASTNPSPTSSACRTRSSRVSPAD